MISVKKYGEDVAIVEENPKIEKVYDNNMRQGEEIVIKKGTPTIKKCLSICQIQPRNLCVSSSFYPKRCVNDQWYGIRAEGK